VSAGGATIDELFAGRAAVVVADAIGAADAAAARARLEQVGFTRYALLDRGSYDEAPVDEPALPSLLEAMGTLAASATGRTLVPRGGRGLRLLPGDYLLAHHDRLHDDRQVEVVLDLSPAPVPGAEVHYRRGGQLAFRFASTPGAAAVVERGPGVAAHHTYVSRRHAGATVVRLVLRYAVAP
jgi:hypothetical protein